MAAPLQTKRRWGPALLPPLFTITLAFVFLAAIMFTALLTDLAEQASRRGVSFGSMLKLGVSQTLALVSLLQGLLALSGTLVLTRALNYLQWGLSAGPPGLPYLDFLALSPMTMEWGLLLIFFGSHSSQSARIWSGMRFLLYALLWFSGIILLFRTSLVVACDTAHSYNVTAGVGPFNASYVMPFLEQLAGTNRTGNHIILPYTYYGWVNNIVTNPTLSTVLEPTGSGPSNISYLLSAGVWGAAPWVPSDYDDQVFVRLNQIPSMQLDFNGKHGEKHWSEDQCEVLGNNTNGNLIAAELCLSTTEDGGINAGLFVCMNGTVDGKCTNAPGWTFMPNLTATVQFYRRTATLLISKNNYTISNPTDMSPAIPVPVTAADLAAYRQVLHWLLDYSSAAIPATSSLLEGFWTAAASNFLGDPVMANMYLQSLHSLLAFPVYAFNANNYGNPDLLAAQGRTPQESLPAGLLPQQFYTQAALVTPYLKLKFDPRLLGVFAACHVLVLVFAAAALAWVACRAAIMPGVSSFPAFDCHFKPEVIVDGLAARAGGEGAKERAVVDPHEVDVWQARDSDVLSLIKHATVRKKSALPQTPMEGEKERDLYYKV